jgi:hypothetical protein
MLNKLPPDVLLRIVTIGERGSFDPSTLRSGEPLRVAYSLSQLCSSLRAFVLNVYLGDVLTAVDFTFVHCDSFLGHGTLAALARAPGLESFAASYLHCQRGVNGQSGDAVVAPLLQHGRLERLKLRGMSGVSDAFMVGAVLPSLEVLDLSYVAAVSSGTLRALAEFPMLRVLFLLGCTNVDDDALEVLWQRGCIAKTLTEINLAYCPVSDAAIRQVLAVALSLQKLVLASSGANLWSTGSYTSSGVSSLQELFPGVIRFQI